MNRAMELAMLMWSYIHAGMSTSWIGGTLYIESFVGNCPGSECRGF